MTGPIGLVDPRGGESAVLLFGAGFIGLTTGLAGSMVGKAGPIAGPAKTGPETGPIVGPTTELAKRPQNFPSAPSDALPNSPSACGPSTRLREGPVAWRLGMAPSGALDPNPRFAVSLLPLLAS